MTGMVCAVHEAVLAVLVCGMGYYLWTRGDAMAMGEVDTQAPIDEHGVLYTVLVYIALVFACFANAGSTAIRRGLEHSHTRPRTLE